MSINFKLIIIVFTLIFSAYGNVPKTKHEKRPLSFSLPYLKSIQPYAINLGYGPMHIHVFIDPKCPRSQEFVTLVSESDKMQKLYSYHIYLYPLKRFKSNALIASIYASKDRLKALQSVMINKKKIMNIKVGTKVIEKIKAIAKVGSVLDVYKRPYLILVKKGKH